MFTLNPLSPIGVLEYSNWLTEAQRYWLEMQRQADIFYTVSRIERLGGREFSEDLGRRLTAARATSTILNQPK